MTLAAIRLLPATHTVAMQAKYGTLKVANRMSTGIKQFHCDLSY